MQPRHTFAVIGSKKKKKRTKVKKGKEERNQGKGNKRRGTSFKQLASKKRKELVSDCGLSMMKETLETVYKRAQLRLINSKENHF